MVILKSRNSDLEVMMQCDLFDETFEKLGFVETDSINCFYKSYSIRDRVKPSDLTIRYISKSEYVKLLELISSDGNNFDLESTEGDSYTKLYFNKSDLTLKRNYDRLSDSYFYSGTLSLGMR